MQSSIKSFFKRVDANKRSSSDIELPPAKRCCGEKNAEKSGKENFLRTDLQENATEMSESEISQKTSNQFGCESSWFEALEKEFQKPYFLKLCKFLEKERTQKTIYPAESEVFSWTRYCPISQIKVVVLGQDPYHGVGQAHGLSFSVPKGIAMPPSLVNIFKELQSDVDAFQRPNHGQLVGWARQGVLMLNACLTVRANEPNSHKQQGWEQFTTAVLQKVADLNPTVVFLLWGSYAQKKVSALGKDKKRHFFLNAPHPSPLSSYRGFFGCKHFSKCNAILQHNSLKPIDWNALPDH